MKAAIAVFGPLCLAACAFSNEGAVDFRRAQPYDAASASKGLQSAAQGPLTPALLVAKDIPSGSANSRIDKKDKVSIRLRDGFLQGCNERLRNPMRQFKKNCEVAILFKAFEFASGEDFNFKPGAEKDARLVYFSKDVQPGQFFNFHNLPVYGPLEYTGKPIGIDIWVLEIDSEDRQAAAVLRTLASIGAKAYAPAAPVLPVLDQLGSALLSSGTDDVELRYTMVLDPGSSYGGAAYSTTEAGDYVFIREGDRSNATDWPALRLDHNTGRVWRQSGDGGTTLYRDNTYLTVQVLRNAGSEDVTLAQNTYGDFRAAIETEATERVTALKTFTDELENLARKRVHIRNFTRVQALYERMVARPATEAVAAKQDAFDLFVRLQDAIKAGNDADLAPDQVDAMLAKLRSMTTAATQAEIAHFTRDGFQKLSFDAFLALIFPVSA